MEKPLIALMALNAVAIATAGFVWLMVGPWHWEQWVSVWVAGAFVLAESFIVCGTIGPALVGWMADKED